MDCKIVSLGSDCVAKRRLEEHIFKEKLQSELFDWVLSDLYTVCQIMENYIIKRPIFLPEKFQILTKTVDDKFAVSHTEFNFVSLHDAPIELGDVKAIHDVSSKYQRRLDRFINEILMSKEKVIFIGVYDKSNPIQYGNMVVDNTLIERFFRMIHTINPLNNHELFLVLDSASNVTLDSPRLRIIKSEEYINMIDYEKDWYRFYFNWDKIV